MSKQTANGFFMFSPFLRYPIFYQELLRGVVSHQQLGCRLIELGEHAHGLRRFDKVREISQLLSNIPLTEFQSVGTYFLAVATNNMGTGDQGEAHKLFELAVDTAPDHYKAKALFSLAAVSANRGDIDSEFYYMLEGAKASPSLQTSLCAQRGIAVVKAKEGYHKQSLQDLKKNLPLIKFAPPLIYFDYLNSLAVELGESGRVEEARNVCKIVLGSPFISAYPEWQETAWDLKKAKGSFVAVETSLHSPSNVLPMPVVGHGKSELISYNQPARVLSLQQWKKKMSKEPSGDPYNKKSVQNMSEKEVFLRALELFSNTKIPGNKRRKMLEAIENVLAGPEPSKPEPADTDGI